MPKHQFSGSDRRTLPSHSRKPAPASSELVVGRWITPEPCLAARGAADPTSNITWMVSATTAFKKTITALAISVRTMADSRAETTDEEDPRHEEDIPVPVREDLCAEDRCRAGDLCAEGPCHVEDLCHAEDRCVGGLCLAEDHEAAVPCLDPAVDFRLLAAEAVHPLLWRPHLILLPIDPTISAEAATRPSLATNESTTLTRNPVYWTTWPPWRSVVRPADDRRRNEDLPWTSMAADGPLWKARGVRLGAWVDIPIRDTEPLRRTKDTAVAADTMMMATERPCRLAAMILEHREGA